LDLVWLGIFMAGGLGFGWVTIRSFGGEWRGWGHGF
jgi:hypothetical protein